jgi:hypothetical protein
MTCNEGWCALLYYVRLMSPWVRSCKHGYYVSSWATIRFWGRNLFHGVCCEKCTLVILPFLYSMDDHTVFQELIFILFIYWFILFIYLFNSHVLYQSHYVLPQYPSATPWTPPFVLRSNKKTSKQTNNIIWSIRPVIVGVLVHSTIDARLFLRPPRIWNRTCQPSKHSKPGLEHNLRRLPRERANNGPPTSHIPILTVFGASRLAII